MARRGGLSAFQEVYKWCRLNRECRGALVIPREVRRELAVAATLVLLAEQRLDAPWFPVATLFDASDVGGGICQSPATVEELQSEARWAVRGGWVTAFGSSETLQDLFPTPEATPELEVELANPRSMEIWVYQFVHLFSGLRRAFDVTCCALAGPEGSYSGHREFRCCLRGGVRPRQPRQGRGLERACSQGRSRWRLEWRTLQRLVTGPFSAGRSSSASGPVTPLVTSGVVSAGACTLRLAFALDVQWAGHLGSGDSGRRGCSQRASSGSRSRPLPLHTCTVRHVSRP